MTETRDQPKTPEASYRLTYEPDDTSFTVRENMVDILERELLGPIHGPKEVLPFSPRSQYLVGHIAPVRLTGVALTDDDSEGVAERGHLVEARTDGEALAESRGVPAFAADENEADAEDDDAEDRAPKQGLMIPASMGLRFQVPPDLETFTVTASWGTYETVQTDKVTKAGRPIRHYQRIPVEEPRTIRLADLKPGQTVAIPLRDTICLRVDRYDDSAFGRVLVEIALCNDRETPMPIPIEHVDVPDQTACGCRRRRGVPAGLRCVGAGLARARSEVQRLNLQYRNRLEYAIGRTCSADWAVKNGARRATAVWTTWLPVAETPQTRARSVGQRAAVHGRTGDGHGRRTACWTGAVDRRLRGMARRASRPPPRNSHEHLQETAELALLEARRAHKRLQAGLEHVATGTEALRCFQFMNAVMRDQRIASQVAAAARIGPDHVDCRRHGARSPRRGEEAASWRPFQLAFILMQLGALSDPAAPLRSADHQARVELLFFPTGGGKTEAYLGLAAYTFAIRRRQGVVDSADGPLDGRDGVAVLMRYTLRLLTAQQFQRATALVCSAELARRADETTWGSEPFRIGLWVGTDVSPKRFEEADEQLTKANEYGAHRLTVLQVQRCPWCGTPITAAQVKADATVRRVFVYCGDELARCPFAKGGQVGEGLPVLTVDEEIYRLTPAFVIATVDKFARLAREGEAAALFGYVGQRCARHGYVHPDYAACNTRPAHPAVNVYPAATVYPVGRLRPPDLIIQDELHLITGALGTSVGLFEVAVETLTSWERPDGKPVRPLIVASTATVRNAQEQVRGLYGRQVEIFPPQVLDVADTFFSQEIPISKENPGRRYVGVSAQGVRLASAEIRVSEVLLSAGQLLFDRCRAEADPYMTLVGYFNATRELAGMARYMADDVQNRVKRPRKDSGFPSRLGASFGLLHIGELTSRIASAEIGRDPGSAGAGVRSRRTTPPKSSARAWPTQTCGQESAVSQRGTVRRGAGYVDAAGRC